MTQPTETPSRTKLASRIIIYLTEELGDARLRAAQLQRYVKEATDLVEKSEHRDHFFEVAAHLIHGIPEATFKLGKALDAAALAAARLDYEEIKQGLKPEKADELEAVMEDARLRYLNRRSNEDQMKPQDVAEYLQKLADRTEAEGKVPVAPMLNLIARLEDRTSGLYAPKAAEFFRKAAQVLGTMESPSKRKLVAVLRRVLADAMEPTAGAMAASILAQAGSREDVMEGFKAANPDLTEAQLKEIADQWEANKDVVKDKTAAEGGELTHKMEKVIFSVEAQLKELQHSYHLYSQDSAKYAPQAVNFGAAVRAINRSTEIYLRASKTAADTGASTALNNLRITLSEAEKDIEDKAGHFWKLWKQVEQGNSGGVVREVKDLMPKVLDAVGEMRRLKDQASKILGYAWLKHAEDESKESKFEEGKPADPTENMTDEQKAEWKKQNEAHKNEFKSAADEDKSARFEEGKPADPTVNMTEEQKAEWKRQNDAHKDQFKSASYDRRAAQ